MREAVQRCGNGVVELTKRLRAQASLVITGAGFSDYRQVDGVMIAFKATASNIANGEITIRVLDVKFDVPIPDSVFQKPANPPKRTDQ